MILQRANEFVHFWQCKAVVLTQLDRSCRAVQIEYCLPFTVPDMHMRWPMIVRIDHDPRAPESENCRHWLL